MHGLFILMHKLKNLSPKLVSKKVTSKYKEQEVKQFVDANTPELLIEDVLEYGREIKSLSKTFSELLTITTVEDVGKLHWF